MNAYVPGYEHDVFVSYTKTDDEPSEGGRDGWVTSFVNVLEKRLIQMLGSDSFSLRTDRKLAANGQLTPKQVAELDGTAIFVIVLSPAYLASDWCAGAHGLGLELTTFLKLVDDRLREKHIKVFVVERTKTQDDGPHEFTGAQRFRFWVRDRNQSMPRSFTPSTGDDDFVEILNDLALEVAHELRRLKKKPPKPNAEPFDVEDDRPTVFLATASDDLNPFRRKVKRYLEQSDVRVLPENWHAETSGFEDLVEQNLAQSHLFVQLLSYSAEEKLAETNESRTAFQARRAIEMSVPILQWRNPQLGADDIETDVDDGEHRDLLLGSAVQAVDLQDFSRDALEKAKSLRKAMGAEQPEQPREGYIFVNMEDPERPTARQLCEYLKRCDLAYVTLEHKGRPDEIRRELVENLSTTDGMIVVYDHADNRWVKAQLREIQRILASPDHRDKASQPKAVYEAPPLPKPPVGIHLKKMTVIDGQGGFDPDKLSTFLDAIEDCAQQRIEAAVEPVIEERDAYDIFLAHNSADKAFVRRIYDQLRKRNIHPWLDDKEIRPGQWVQDHLQKSIENCKSAACFIGQHGLGRWQRVELRAFFDECIARDLLLIPILLPGVSEVPADAPFLRQLHWVQFNSDDDQQALDTLMSSIPR